VMGLFGGGRHPPLLPRLISPACSDESQSMRSSSVLVAVKSTEFFGVMLFVFAVMFPPFDDVAEVDLSFHMLQHVVIIVAGATIAYSLLRKGIIRPKPGWTPKVLLLGVATSIVFWHLPALWDAAVLNPLVHAAEHFTFLLVGFAIGSFLQALSDSAKIAALLAAFFGHMAYAAILVAPWNLQVYPLFSVADQAILGWALLLTGWAFLVGVAYIVRRNPAWLQGFSGGGAKPASEGFEPRRGRTATWVAPAASAALVLVLLAYFVATGLAVAAAAGPPPAASVVFIVETPVTWQYSPQAILVVLGTNNTVTWISHSTSYDTITSDTGLFQSGLIQPGGSFSYTFTAPGVYSYHCAFHPWMVGKVTVVAGG
jgi:plastocyanin